MRRVIWTYWENPPDQDGLPPHIQLCRRALERICSSCAVEIVTPDNVRNFLPDLPEKVSQITRAGEPNRPCLPIKCTFIRAFLIERYGGIYVDADNIVLRDLGKLFGILNHREFMCMRRTSLGRAHVSIGFYGARVGSQIMAEYAALLRSMLRERTALKWGEAGAHALTPIVDKHSASVHFFPEAEVQPIVAEQQNVLADEEDPMLFAQIMQANPIIITLYHRLFNKTGPLTGWSIDKLQTSNALVSKAFRHALATLAPPPASTDGATEVRG